MKTIEQKVKAYDEALEKAKEFYKGYKQRDNQLYADDLETIFPEPRESEEERTINCIGMCLTDANEQRFKDYGTTLKDCLAWLKKQGEKESNKMSIWKHWKAGICGNGEGKLIYLIKDGNNYSLSSCLGFECDYIELSELDKLLSEKQGGQKSVDKVERRFKVGDWITNSIETAQITGYDIDYGYQVDYKGNLQHRDTDIIEKEYHLWTIQDAKDGDVLAGSKGDVILMFRGIGNTAWHDVIDFHCYYNCYREDFIVQEGLGHWGDTENSQLKPATKEQCGLLFQKMHEAGYMWDSESKQLLSLKAEPSVEQKSTWSEEDKHRMKDVMCFLETAKKHYASVIELDDCIDYWIKYIKQRIGG